MEITLSDEQEARYKVVFLGPVQNDLANVNKLAEGLKDRFKLTDEAVTRLMRMAPIAIKKGATFSEAQKYKEFLEAIGAKVQIEAVEEVQEELQQTGESPPPLDGEPQAAAGNEETAPFSLETAFPQREEPQAEGEDSSPLDREPQIIPVKTKAPPSSAESTISSSTKAKAGAQMVTCPQCGYVQEQTDECIKCGVVISKFLKYLEAVKPVEGEGASPAAVASPGAVASPAAEGPQAQRDIGIPLEEASGSTPWEDIASLGFFTAFFRTAQEVFNTPDIFFRRMPVNHGILNPLLYGIIAGYIGALITSFWQYAFSGMFGGGLNFSAVSSVIFHAFILPILIIIILFVGSIIIHISVMIFGGKRGFEATFRVLSFSNSIQLVSVVPLFGALYALIFYPVLIVVGLKETHRITMGRSALAVFVSLIIGLLIIGGIVLLLLMTIFATFMGSMMPQQPSPGF